ncbi:MAG: ABC transporter ATP-binding protein [Brevinematia bacterium]
MIEVVNISKYYVINGNKRVLFEGLSFNLSEGDFISVTGESGCGKTTLLKIVSGIERPSSGYISYNGVIPRFFRDFFVSNFRRKNIGFVFQTFELLEGLSVIDNILLAIYISGEQVSKYRSKAKEVLEYVGMSDYINVDVRVLSGGQKQRIALARALIKDPRYIFADEPTANLDEKNSLEIISLLEKINKEKNVGIVFVTHRKDVMNYSNKVIYISDSKAYVEENKKS